MSKNYVEAAAVLRKGNKVDLLVSYLSLYVSEASLLQVVKTNKSYRNREHIPPHVHHTYSRLCKVLLKQGKISDEYRKDAVNILGSPAEQESYFIEYEMYDDLAEFYVTQQKHEDHFFLLVKLCRLEEALHVWFAQQLSDCPARIPEKKILTLLDYVCAGMRTQGSSENKVANIFKNSDKIFVPQIASRVQQWMHIAQIDVQGSTVLQGLELKSLDLRALLSVQVSDKGFKKIFNMSNSFSQCSISH